MNDNQPVSIIIPVRPGGEVRAVERLRTVNYPAGSIEVLVAEGCSPSRQRNRAAAMAKGKLVYFLDDDSLVDPAFLQRAVERFVDPRVAAVGGPSLTPATDTFFQRAVGLVISSPFGGGGARNRYRRTGAARPSSERELILCNLAFRRELFLAFGGLDERLYPNEENELMDRLLTDGWLLVHDPELAIYRSQRPSFRAFMRQFFGYGTGRGEQTRIAGLRHGIDFAPAFFLAYLLLLPWAPTLLWFIPLICYGALLIAAAVAAAWQGRAPAAIPLLFILFPTLHLSYGAGLLKGVLRPRFAQSQTEPPAVAVRVIKELGMPWAAAGVARADNDGRLTP
ncbi:glycosyl transferase family 2 [Geobacter metallireducens RCH3]|uniref:Glycosyltransferase 2-like domain-containing protein n=1 Tax=Geobacter metallireducens (strain ATCC 53774 / DSM 7210 / GS-15) TaxID=269799 RepID=Q39RL2_GEOMG|nr:glycosyltransferase [Geobacter metallireducens]ABB33112.2 hypothetical protein Gmet_2894 [Geobacter metallireducens GS-15]EHP87111.1 glycosyl transferase family 2 [Geobacter metallireducens RCH3]